MISFLLLVIWGICSIVLPSLLAAHLHQVIEHRIHVARSKGRLLHHTSKKSHWLQDCLATLDFCLRLPLLSISVHQMNNYQSNPTVLKDDGKRMVSVVALVRQILIERTTVIYLLGGLSVIGWITLVLSILFFAHTQ